MRSIWFKLALFLFLWYEVAAELRLDGDRSFVLSVVIVCVGWFMLRMSGTLVTLFGPNTQRLAVGLVLWFTLFWWFAPPILKAQPIVFVLAGAAGIAVVGARLRHWLSGGGWELCQAKLRAHSGLVVGTVLACLSALLLSQQFWLSVWSVVGHVLLLGLPFGFGWQMAELAGARRFDAKVGKEEEFRSAGYSEER